MAHSSWVCRWKESFRILRKGTAYAWMYLGFAKYFILRHSIYDVITKAKGLYGAWLLGIPENILLKMHLNRQLRKTRLTAKRSKKVRNNIAASSSTC